MLNGMREVLDIDERAYVALVLPQRNRAAGCLVALRTQRRRIDAGLGVHVVGRDLHQIDGRYRKIGRRIADWRTGNVRVALINQDRIVLAVGALPLGFMSFDLHVGREIWALGRQRHGLRGVGLPVIVLPLGILGVPDQAVADNLVPEMNLFAKNRDDWEVLAHPRSRPFKNLLVRNEILNDVVSLDRSDVGDR